MCKNPLLLRFPWLWCKMELIWEPLWKILCVHHWQSLRISNCNPPLNLYMVKTTTIIIWKPDLLPLRPHPSISFHVVTVTSPSIPEARALEQSPAGLWRPSHFARENLGRYSSHHCQKGVHYTAGTKEGAGENTRWVEQAEVEMRGGDARLKKVPKLPASDDQSVHQRGLTGAHWNSSAGRTKKHPPWESAFSPARRRVMDWAGQCTQCICEERERAKRWGGVGWGQGLSEKHFHFTPRMH